MSRSYYLFQQVFRNRVKQLLWVCLLASSLLALGIITSNALATSQENTAVQPETDALITDGPVQSPALLAAMSGPGNITGTVFRDFDSNGEQDISEPGVISITVSAYDDAGFVISTTTNITGEYTLATLTDGTSYRIEVSDIPSYLQPGVSGANNGTTVLFATSPSDDIDVALQNPTDYCESDPELVTTCFVQGDESTATTLASVVRWDQDGATSGRNEYIEYIDELGSLYGIEYQVETNHLFVGAFAKRHAAWGHGEDGIAGNADDSGAIYVINNTEITSAESNVIDIFTIPNTGNTPRAVDGPVIAGGGIGDCSTATTGTNWVRDSCFFDSVGKEGLGDLELSQDRNTLWAVNLFDRHLYMIDVTPNGANYGTVYDKGEIADPGCTGGASDWRPFALEFHDGELYVGGICSGQANNTQPITKDTGTSPNTYNDNISEVSTEILRFDDPFNTATATATATDFFSYDDMDYNRGLAKLNQGFDGNLDGRWFAWVTEWDIDYFTVSTAGSAYQHQVYPQPILSDIEFDTDGSMILGFRDRMADQVGFRALSPGLGTSGDPYTTTTYIPDSGGDIIRVCWNGSAYEWEGTGSCPTNGNSPDEPDSGSEATAEYYPGEYIQSGTVPHQELAQGALAFAPRFAQVATTVMDPVNYNSGGVHWYDNTTGAETQAYEVYAGGNSPAINGGLGKGNGLGDLELLCEAAPFELGNRVWFDADGDGVQDPSESPLSGITVGLYDAGGNLVATAVTDTDGEYYFIDTSHPEASSVGNEYGVASAITINSDYEIRIDTQQPALSNYALTTANSGGDNSNDNKTDLNDSDGVLSGSTAVITITTGIAGANNHTLDFGFTQLGAIGNYVWVDENSDGVQDEGERGIPNVTVQLKDSAGTVIATTTTDSQGGYLFTDLPPADYFVDVDESTIPTGMTQTDPYTNNIDGDDADAVTDDGDLGNKDHDSDGYPITLDSGEENLTADFGYNYNPTDDVDNGENTAALGDRIWIDSDGDGVQDPNEVGVSGATLTLITAGPDGIFGTADDVNGPTTTTDANGYYIFDSLTPGAYQVEVTDDTGASHDILGAEYQQTGDPDHFATSEADHPNDNEEDDNKATVPVVLGPGDVFLNVDFGYQPDSAVLNSVGDTIFYDADMDGNGPFLPPVDGAIPGTQGEGGTADASDYGIAGVTVALIQDTDGDGLWDAGEPIIATDITDSNGQYLFEDLPDDDYLIWVNDTDNVLDGLTQSYDSDGALGTPNISAVDLDDDGSNGSAVADRLQDFGYGQSSPLGAIGDTVWFDVDNSGGDQTTQGAEPGIAGVTVNLYQDEDGDGSPDDVNGDGTVDSNDIIKSTVTNGNGNYLFDQLPFGGYVVEVDTTTLPAQYDTTATYEADSDNDDLGTAVTLTAAAPTDFNQDFSYTLTDTTLGSIGDQVWGDLDSSGTNAPNAGDVPLPGVTVQLTDSSGNVQTTVTDGEGYYLFPNLPADTYTITVDTTTLPVGFTVTPTYDPDAPDDSQSVKTLTAGEHDRLQDFSYPPGGTGEIYSLGDRVWFDANNSNGDQATQGSEPGLQGVTVTLLDDSGNVVAETTTDVNGDYLFTGLTAGQYTVTVDTTTLPSYASPVSTHDGSDDAGTPDGDATSADITVGPGADAHKRAEDFSFPPATPLGGLGDTIFIDDDNTDGDDFEPNDNDIPLEGVTVILTYPSGVTVTTVTDENGKYYFGNLPLNETYAVTVDTTTLPGGDTKWSNTADPNRDDNSTSTVILTPASPINLDQDFGYQASAGTPGSIGNLVWEDVDADGLLDTGEAGIPGVTLDLYYDANGDGEINPGEPRIGTATTDGSGAYLFDGLPIDDGSGDMAYIVDVTDRDGVLAGYWHSLSPNQDATTSDSGSATTAEDDDDNSKADAFPVVLTTAVPNNLNVDFGYYKEPASLGNYVWYDADADGIQDSGESGVDGITVTLTITYPNGDLVTLRTVTGDDPSTSGTTETGWYSFDNLLYDEDYRVGSGTTVTGTNQPAYAITVDTGQYVPTFNDVTSGGGNDQNDSDLSGVVALPTQGSETVTQNSDPELESDPIATYDFGVVRVDLGDLPDTSDTTGSGNYQTVLSDNGAAHTILDVNNDGTPDAGQIYLGATIDAENEGQQSTYATGDGDDEDGVTVNLADWENGTDGGQVGIDVTGGSGYVVGWFDFDNDGVFDTMVTQAVTAGSNNVNVDVPASTFLANGSSGGSNVTVYARFRLFTDETAANAVAGGALSTTAGFDGLAVNGEVEDYVWNFTPTAVGLAHNTTTNQPFISIEVLVVLFLMLLSASVLAIGLRRRSAI